MDTPEIPLAVVQRQRDEEQLSLLAVFHYVVAGLGALFACFPLIHIAIGTMLFLQPEFMTKGQSGELPPQWFGLIFVIMGGVFVLTGWTAAICTFLSRRYLSKRKNRMFSFVMGAVLCLFMPFGTILGVFTIVVLSKDSVKALYGKA